MILRLFPLWALLLSAGAVLRPQLFLPLTQAIVPLLGVVMFMMGLTLSFDDFRRVLAQPLKVLTGVSLQFGLMPLFAWLLSRLLELPLTITIGMVLVGACPGGTASNVICYLARGDVALSITLTATATVLAVALTPLLTWLWIGARVDVPMLSMLWTIVQIILLPVLLGVVARRFAERAVRRVARAFPYLAMLSIVLIIAAIVAANAGQLGGLVAPVITAVVMHNLLGLLAGYGVARLLGWDRSVCRTLSIEVGMQNSGLGVALAHQYFSAAAALPGALFSIWHNVSGSMLAGAWARGQPARDTQ